MYHSSLNNVDQGRRSQIDPRNPIWLICGRESGGKSELIAQISGNAIATGDAPAIVFTDEASWAATWRGGTSISKNIARSESGLICCYAGSDIVDAFYQLHLRKLGLLSPKLEFDTILVSLNDKMNAGAFVRVVQNNDRIDVTYRIAKIVGVIDPSRFNWKLDDLNTSCVGEADTLVLTNSGDCSEQDLAAIRNQMMMFNPLASIFCSVDTLLYTLPAWNIPLGYFSEYNGQVLGRETGMVRLSDDDTTPICFAGNLHNMAGTNVSDDLHVIRAMRINIPGELDMAAFMQIVHELTRSLGTQLLRLSALLNVRHVDRPISIEIIGGSLIQPSYGSDKQTGKSDICIIARGINVKEIWWAFGECAWQSASVSARFESAM